MRRVLLGVLGVFVLAATFGSPAVAAERPQVGKIAVSPDAHIPRFEGKAFDVPTSAPAGVNAPTRSTPDIGDTRFWLAVDFIGGFYYFKEYELRGLGDSIEVWVAADSDAISTGTDFQDGDCRNGVRTEITDAQVDYLVDQYDNNILPIERDAFSVAPPLDGSHAPLASFAGLPPNYYAGDGDRVVTLVDNVRDDNFYDLNNTNGYSYVAGFFDSFQTFLYQRNAMSIDAFDWIHRTGANPPHEPVPGDNCASAPARPFLYEGVFAHEYQHLLESYEDPNETNWINEGLSDWAQTITNYVNPATPVTQIGFDSHIACFTGDNEVLTGANPNPRPGGPENSLTLWGDQDFDHEQEILCDYGAAYGMMEYLAEKYGHGFMEALHEDDEVGLASLQALLDVYAPGTTAKTVLKRWAAMWALDRVLDDGAVLKGGTAPWFQVDTLDGHIRWNNDDAYDTPGAPPNGSDYVRFRNGGGTFLNASAVKSVEFQGVSELPSLPIEWSVDGTMGSPAPSLHSGVGDNLDRAIVREVAVPAAGDMNLYADIQWDTETDFDYAYIQVSDDGGETYNSIACANSNVTAPLGPGYEGSSGGFVAETCDLSAWAGQTVVVAFRYVTDASVIFDGFWVDNVAIGATLLSDGSTLAGWLSLTQYNPIDVEGYIVRLIAYRADHTMAWIGELPLDGSFHGFLSGAALDKKIGTKAKYVAAIVTYFDGSEMANQYAGYTLEVNGVTQPGGDV